MRTRIGFVLCAAIAALAISCDSGEAMGDTQGDREGDRIAQVGQDGQGQPLPGNQVPKQPPQLPRTPGKDRVMKGQTPPKRPPQPVIQPPPGPQPRIVFEHKKYDFKTVIKGEMVSHAFPFENKGEGTLIVDKVTPSCGCVAAPLKKNQYEPGETGEIEVSFNSGLKSPGLQRFTIAVYSNDYQERDRGVKVSVLEFQGDVIVFFKAVPPQFYLQRVFRGESASRSLTLHSTSLEGEILEVDRVEVSDPTSLQVRIVRPSPRAGTQQFGPDAVDLVLTFTPRKIGPLSENLTVYTTSKKQPKIEIPVRGVVEGDIKVMPPTIYVRNYRKGGTLVPNSIRITRTRGQSDLKILGLEATEGLIVNEQQIVAGRDYMIRLQMDAKRQPGIYGGEVRVFVNSEEQPMVSIPVVVHVGPTVEATPDSVYFEANAGEEFETRLIVKRFSPASPVARRPGSTIPTAFLPLKLSVGGEGPVNFTAEIIEPEKTGQPHQIVLRLKPGVPPGAVADSLILVTDVQGEEEVIVPIHGILAQGT